MTTFSAEETDLDIPHLRQLWSRILVNRASTPEEWEADQIVMHGLGLGLGDTLRFLYEQRPSFQGFERWVIERNSGPPNARQAALVNQAVRRALLGGRPNDLSADFHPELDESDLRFWHENGYVVLRGAVPPDACDAAARAIWGHLGISPDAPEAWDTAKGCEGIFVNLVRHPAFDANRASKRIRGAFAQLWGTEDLMVTTDRGGFNPPETSDRKFRGQDLHWDTSLTPPIPLNIQGLLYLTDTPTEQGAFRCVPGFHRRIEQWLASLPPGADPRAQDLSAEAVPVAGKAGDMVLWHAALPHGASPNRGAQPRLVQYIAWWPFGKADTRSWS